jgi:hypothetical protein
MSIIDYVIFGVIIIFAFALLLGFAVGSKYLYNRWQEAKEKREEAEERRAEEQAEEIWRGTLVSHMRNRMGLLNIYWKALWMTVLIIVLPLGAASAATWGGLSTGEWGLLGFAIFLWLLAGFVIWLFRDEFWDVWRDAVGGRASVSGSVSRKWVDKTTLYHRGIRDTSKDYSIGVKRHDFKVSRRIYLWLSQGDEVVVHYWLRTETVSKVERLSAA